MIRIFKLKNIISIKDFDREDIDYILEEASKLEDIAKSKEISEELKGKILGLMFFEPSTRTRMSFETAMKRLNGECIGFETSGSSSVSKGESIADTAKMFEGYSDALVIRHELEGVSKFISDIVDVPVINAGDGAGQHPTQTLLDLYTIKKEIGEIDNLKIALIGDLKFGRTVHSLINALVRYPGIKFVLISPEELRVPEYIREDVLEKNGYEYKEVDTLDDVMGELDILYMTRVQRERFFNEEDYIRLKDFFILTPEKMNLAKKDMMVLHPLPRVNEIAVDVDDDPRAMYFTQAKYGVFIRMALILTLLEIPC